VIYIDAGPAQVYEEILGLAKLVGGLELEAVLEIGTAGGGTLFMWCRLASDDAKTVSVDLPGGPLRRRVPHVEGSSLQVLQEAQSKALPHQRGFARPEST